MRWLTRTRSDEGGAVIVLVAVATIMLVGMAALVVDVGAALDEKRQLQNGADAAALAVASSCLPPGPCDDSRNQYLADQNAHDASMTIDRPTYDPANKKVTVKTSTKTGGKPILPYNFGQVLTGAEGKGYTATATATWSGLKSAKVVPLAISQCDFDRATAPFNKVFDVAVVVVFHGNDDPCTVNGSSGADFPGGFGWVIPDAAVDCSVVISVNNTVIGDTGAPGTPGACVLSTLLNKDILIPIYDGLVKNSKWEYHIHGFAQFHLTAYSFPTQKPPPAKSCANGAYKSTTCIGGYFVRFVSIGDYGGPNLGGRVALVP